jgi:hypothetical protein
MEHGVRRGAVNHCARGLTSGRRHHNNPGDPRSFAQRGEAVGGFERELGAAIVKVAVDHHLRERSPQRLCAGLGLARASRVSQLTKIRGAASAGGRQREDDEEGRRRAAHDEQNCHTRAAP